MDSHRVAELRDRLERTTTGSPNESPGGTWVDPTAGHVTPRRVDTATSHPPTPDLGTADEQCAWLFSHFDADKDGMLNRLEYKEFLKSIDVWGRSDAYSDVYWAWTWRQICMRAACAPAEGLDIACFSRRYAGPGRCAMLATDVDRVRSASVAARARRPSETVSVWLSPPCVECAPTAHKLNALPQMLEVNCAAGHVMPLVPWSAGPHNPAVRAHRQYIDASACADLRRPGLSFRQLLPHSRVLCHRAEWLSAASVGLQWWLAV